MSDTPASIASRALSSSGLCSTEAAELALSLPLDALLSAARLVREHTMGKRVSFCGIVNAKSGRCSEDCAYCAQSSHWHGSSQEYGVLEPGAIAGAALRAQQWGASCFGIVTSGNELTEDEFAVVCEAVRLVRERCTLTIAGSLGRMTAERLAALKAAGLDRYHHNLETSRRFFASICTTHSWDDRVATVRAAQAAGLDVCCGGLVGLGETMHDRAELAQAILELGVSSVPLNFLEPIPGTPLGERARLAPEEALRTVALFRLMLPQAYIRICGGRARTMGEREYELLDIADCLMTGDYLTTAGPSPERDRENALKLGYQPT